ncbi:hypothetical protein [Myceligenerans indicum]|uniref:Uncharacterized protein n=1 Tax=Myceligenerans indicum TaxID=2593663 RepID=A0ABS1LI59_9MICO|nr:hypothetical protein [Myceligenerans indicum]MBL0885906.1 hypothetical protein [Myceligenerans indicum]
MLIDWTPEFDRWHSDVEDKAAAGDEQARITEQLIDAELTILNRLTGIPGEESPALKQVRQSNRYQP